MSTGTAAAVPVTHAPSHECTASGKHALRLTYVYACTPIMIRARAHLHGPWHLRHAARTHARTHHNPVATRRLSQSKMLSANPSPECLLFRTRNSQIKCLN